METLNIQLFTDSLRKLFALKHVIDKKEKRFYLTGVYVERESDRALRFTATDGHMLLSYVGDAVGVGESDSLPEFQPFILSLGDFKLPRKLNDQALYTFEIKRLEGYRPSRDAVPDVQVSIPQIAFFGHLIEGTYPEWRRFVPQLAANVQEKPVGAASLDPLLLGRLHKAFLEVNKHIIGVRLTAYEDHNAYGVWHNYLNENEYALLMPVKL